MKSFIETFKEENAETEYCAYCLKPRAGYFCCNKQNPYLEFKDFSSESQIKIMKEELQSAYN
jgi:hypothetical protein